MIKDWPNYEGLSEKLLAIIPKYDNTVKDIVNAKKSIFNVILHGDLWVNNFLYKYEQNSITPMDLMFVSTTILTLFSSFNITNLFWQVDFQNCFWGSCGFDINWFLNTSLKLNVLKEHRQELVHAYYDSLIQTLVQIDYPTKKIPSLQDVLDEIKRCEFIGLYTSFCELPLVALDKSQSKGFDCNTFGEPDKMKVIRVLMYNNPRVQETLKYTLKYFQEINIL